MFLRNSRSNLCVLDALPTTSGNSAKADVNSFRIGFDTASVSITLFQALRQFGVNYPSLVLDLIQADPAKLMGLLKSEMIDLALMTAAPLRLPADMASLPMPRRQLSLLLPVDHLLAKAMQVDLALMNTDPLIVYDDRTSYSNRELALRACQRAGFKPHTVIETNSYAAMAGMIAAGRGYSVCPDDPNLYTLRSAMSIVPLFQSWDSPGTLSMFLRTSDPTYRDEFLRSFTSKHRSRR